MAPSFLSTLSLRRATQRHLPKHPQNKHFYPRSPCGERRALGLLGWLRVLISIHALLAESDQRHLPKHPQNKHFYPRSPCGERLMHPLLCNVKSNFYPRSPCGERPFIMIITICTVLFLSTLSLRRATSTGLAWLASRFDFYPRSPCGERQSLWSAY